MKRIKAACIAQTLCFSSHDGETTEYAKKGIVQEYEKYKALENFCKSYAVSCISPPTNHALSLTFVCQFVNKAMIMYYNNKKEMGEYWKMGLLGEVICREDDRCPQKRI